LEFTFIEYLKKFKSKVILELFKKIELKVELNLISSFNFIEQNNEMISIVIIVKICSNLFDRLRPFTDISQLKS